MIAGIFGLSFVTILLLLAGVFVVCVIIYAIVRIVVANNGSHKKASASFPERYIVSSSRMLSPFDNDELQILTDNGSNNNPSFGTHTNQYPPNQFPL
jgi:hypothetical protein